MGAMEGEEQVDMLAGVQDMLLQPTCLSWDTNLYSLAQLQEAALGSPLSACDSHEQSQSSLSALHDYNQLSASLRGGKNA